MDIKKREKQTFTSTNIPLNLKAAAMSRDNSLFLQSITKSDIPVLSVA